MSGPLPTLPVHAIDPEPDGAQWLIQDLWGACAVGIIGGAPKACKSTLALDLAVSVASGTACLGRFEVHTPGPVVVYLAEDALPRVRDRVAQLCQYRGISLSSLDLHVVTATSLRLDLERDQNALDQTLTALRPKLLVLDPLVRLHRLDELCDASHNSSYVTRPVM
jgi:RecA-family ATPase